MREMTAAALGVAEPRRSLPLAAVRSYDISKAERDLGYRPKTTFAEGIREAVDWYTEHGYL